MSKRNIRKRKFLKIFGDKEIYHSIRESCRLANIGKSTFYRWLKDNKFKEEITDIERKRNKDSFKDIKRGNITASIRFLKNYRRCLGY